MLQTLTLLLLFVGVLEAEILTRVNVLMGTFVSLSLPQEKKHLFSPSFKIIQNIEKSLSSYDAESIIYRLNHKREVTLNNCAYDALKLSRRYYQKTDGYFNIAIGSITKELYHFGEVDARVPNAEELRKSKTRLKGLHFNRYQASVDEGITIDLGGMGKGYGVDKVRAFLKKEGVKEARIAFSGDICCIGVCKIEIQNPFAKGTFASFEMQDMGVSTSGTYNRYVKDREHNHLINPKSKSSEQSFISITLISKLPNGDLDAYATASSVMPKKRAFRFLKDLDLAYIIVDTHKKLYISTNIESYVHNLKIDTFLK